jgi:hypothetical protein
MPREKMLRRGGGEIISIVAVPRRVINLMLGAAPEHRAGPESGDHAQAIAGAETGVSAMPRTPQHAALLLTNRLPLGRR